MREIYYRVWDKKNKRWVGHNIHIEGSGIICWAFGYECKPVSREDFEIQMFTGLKDREGVDVYEGDIVTFSIEKGFEDKAIMPPAKYGEAIFSNFRFQLATENCGVLLSHIDNVAVVGNIYENPDLLTPAPSHDVGK